jgi:hypothetical protein
MSYSMCCLVWPSVCRRPLRLLTLRSSPVAGQGEESDEKGESLVTPGRGTVAEKVQGLAFGGKGLMVRGVPDGTCAGAQGT